MPLIRIEAPAKLNLHLCVGDRRPDGFHDIESLFLALAFGDVLYLETAPATGKFSQEIDMEWQFSRENSPPPAIPPEKNIIFRAVSLFRNRTGWDRGLRIRVEKRIPLGSGLGGGSSNAAAALLALSLLFSQETDSPGHSSPDRRPASRRPEALLEMGASLGSDVPFFLYSTDHRSAAAWVSGRGERVQPLALPKAARSLFLVLVYPGFSSDTAKAFGLIDKYRRINGYGCSKLPLPPAFPVSAPQEWPFFNDFLPVFSEKTIYQDIISSLRELGADFAGLSGSGSACFGVFSGRDKAVAAGTVLLKRWRFVIVTYPLARRTIKCYNND